MMANSKYLTLIVLIISQGLVPVFQVGTESGDRTAARPQSLCAPDAMPAAPAIYNHKPIKISGMFRFLSFSDLSGVLSVSASCQPSGLQETIFGKAFSLHFPHTLLTLGCLLTV